VKVIDPGHVYELDRLDGDGCETLTFVKREGPGYPGNVGHHAGTNMQEVLRALMDRVRYLDRQIPDLSNLDAIGALRDALFSFEVRAATRHGRPAPVYSEDFEYQPTCARCGHVGCDGTPHSGGSHGQE
jgi:hypothetical protein